MVKPLPSLKRKRDLEFYVRQSVGKAGRAPSIEPLDTPESSWRTVFTRDSRGWRFERKGMGPGNVDDVRNFYVPNATMNCQIGAHVGLQDVADVRILLLSYPLLEAIVGI